MNITLKKNRVLELSGAVRITGQLNSFYGGFTVDSRKVADNFIFAAIHGHEVDGHIFIPKAVEKGAVLILTERDPSEIKDAGTVAIAQVPDIRLAAARLAFAFAGNPQRSLRIVGITGTNGKTTVSTLVYQVLTILGFRAGLLGTVEKKIAGDSFGVKLTTADPEQIAHDLLEMVEADCTHVVMEVSSHALDQRRTDPINFDVAAFTNLSHDHLDYHETPEAYLKAKKRLFDKLGEDQIAVINSDAPEAEQIASDCKAAIWHYGLKDESMRILSNDASGLSLEVDGTRIDSELSGDFNAYNLAAAFLICRALGCSAGNTAAALAQAKGARGRLERISVAEAKTALPSVFVDYAHTPDALENVLSTLRKMVPEQQLIVVFGCGGNRDRTKRSVMGRIAGSYADTIVVTSDNPRFEQPEIIIREIMQGLSGKNTLINPDRPAAITEAIAMAEETAVVLIAGKGHETYQEVMGVRFEMDDSKLAAQALRLRAGLELNRREDI